MTASLTNRGIGKQAGPRKLLTSDKAERFEARDIDGWVEIGLDVAGGPQERGRRNER